MTIKTLYRNKLARNKFDYVNNTPTATTQIFSPYSTGSSDGKNGEDGIVLSLEKYNLSIPGNFSYAEPFYDEVSVSLMEGSVALNAYFGTLENIPDGMTVTKMNDGTTTAYLAVEVADDHSLSDQTGHIKIPVRTSEDSTLYYNVFLSWNIALKGKDGESVYAIHLTNQSTSIYATSDGTIPESAERPTCTATLMYGEETVPTATYSITIPSTYAAQGVSINPSTGVITFNDGESETPFSFTGDVMHMVISGTVGTTTVDSTMTISKAKTGMDGKGVAAPFRGEWSATETYYGNNDRTDIVHYKKVDETTGEVLIDSYYIALTTAGTFSGYEPTETDYWKEFGATYSSVATDLLFAKEVIIENGVIRKLRTEDTGKRIYVEDNTILMYDDDDNIRLKVSGDKIDDTLPSSTSFYYQLPGGGAYIYPENFRTGATLGPWKNETSFTIEDETNKVVIPNIPVSFTLTSGENYGDALNVYATVNIYVDDNIKQYGVGYVSVATGESSKTVSTTINGFTLTGLSVGTHTIKGEVYYRASASGVVSFAQSYATMMLTSSKAQVSISYPIQRMGIGENGMSLYFGSDYMFKVLKTGTTDDTIEMSMKTNEYGVKCTSAGLQLMFGGTWYTATRVYNGTLGGYYLKLT